MSRFFGALVIPALCAAVVGYFGYYAIWGTRGLLMLSRIDGHLSARQEQLSALHDQRLRLQHRISLLEPGSVDPDLVQELARDQLMDGGPGQVAIPRNAH